MNASLIRVLQALVVALLLGVSASAWAASASPVSSSQIHISWNATLSTYFSRVYRWVGYWQQVSGDIWGWGWQGFTDGGLAQGTSYSYMVVVWFGADGSTETYSEQASATTYLDPPAAPSSLGATPISGTQINISWSDNSGYESNFKIERKTGAGGSWSQITTVGANTTSYSNTGLSPDTTYYYRVRANNASGDSGYTNEANATTTPNAPTGLSATAAAGPQANLSWTDASASETGYKIEKKVGAGGTWSQIATVGASVTSYSDTDVTGGGGGNTYYYRVRAYNATNSGYSNEATVSFVVPNAPTNLTVADLTNGNVRLSWTDNADSETGFKLQRKTGAAGTWSQVAAPAANATSQDDSGLTPQSVYYYRVAASNLSGDSAWSNEISITATLPNYTAGTVTYKYDAFGNLVETNAGGVITTLQYDTRGRKIAMSDPDMGSWTYAYDARGRLVSQTDAKNQTTTTAYDVLGRMTTRTEPDLVSNWYYDKDKNGIDCPFGKGKLCEVDSPLGAGGNGYNRKYTFDDKGRVSALTTTIDTAYTLTTSYDAASRVETVTYPTGFATRNVYNTHGHLEKVINAATPSLEYWKATSVSASGKVLTELLGNALTTTRTYDVVDRLKTISSTGTGGTPHSNTYQYDLIGNLTQRVDVTQNVTENLTYDSLNRVISSSGPSLVTKAYDYDAIGNITYRSGVGVYTYGTKPHAVASVSGPVSATYNYDANGNLATASGTGAQPFARALAYTSFNKPATICEAQGTGASAQVTYQGADDTDCTMSGGTAQYKYIYTYSPEYERVRLVHSTLGTFIYLHPGGKGELLYEKEIKPGGLVEHKHYISGGAGLVGVYVSRSDSTTAMRYYHKDHLGSVQVITNEAGAIVEHLAYEPFGKRRYPNGNDDPNNAIFGVTTDRGFTSHEHLDEVALIHMNGRIYDPVLARFMTPDSFIQAPGNLQSYNRYSYTINNPLAYTDPSGHWFFFAAAVFVGAFAAETMGIISERTAALVSNIAAMAMFAYAAGPGIPGADVAHTLGAVYNLGPITSGALGGLMGGMAVSDGNFKSAVISTAAAAGFGWAGGVEGAASYALHALVGCGIGEMSGGECASGALGAVAGKFATNHVKAGIVGAAVAGGVGTALGGGKFKNGAVTGAFGYLFNACSDGVCGGSPEESGAPVGRGVDDANGKLWLPGTGAADRAVDYWVDRDNVFMGTLASAWTADNALTTALAASGGVAGMFRPYWQYYPAGAQGYASNWLVRGWNPPYALGDEAVTKLALPPYNTATAVRQVNVRFWEFVRGPRGVTPNYGQPGGGLEWKRGTTF